MKSFVSANINTRLIKVTIVLLTIFVLTACGPGADKTAPVIASAENVNKVITITASDNVTVTGYYISAVNNTPNADSSGWITSNTSTVGTERIYYVWAKDAAGNISDSFMVERVIESAFTRLAGEYKHIAWALDTTKTKVVDGITYDLDQLKSKYGYLYPMVEPLSDEEIQERWEYLVNYFVNDAPVDNGEYFRMGIVRDNLGDSFGDEVSDFYEEWNNALATSDDELLKKYNSYYTYYEKVSSYVETKHYNVFTSNQTDEGVGLDNIDTISIENREYFVRRYLMDIYFIIGSIKEAGVEPVFSFDPENQN